MYNTLCRSKLLTLDKRTKSFVQGYRQNIALLGSDPQETSYLLKKYLQSDKINEITYICTTTNYTDKKGFFKAVVFSLLTNYTYKNDSLDNLLNYAHPGLDSTISFIKECLSKSDITLLDILEVISKFINDTNRKCILIIEEFTGLKNLFKNFYEDFSKFIILQCNCMLVLTSSYLKEAQRILATELNLLFGNFEKVFLNEENSLDNFIYLKGLLKPISPSPLFLSYFINILGSNIIYYDIFAKIIKENYNPDNEESSIISALDEAFYSEETYLFQKFSKNIDLLKFSFKDFDHALKLLLSLSDGYLRKKELVSLGIYDSKDINIKIQKLTDLNYVNVLGNIHKIKDPLFSFWLSNIFKFYSIMPIFDPVQKKTIFKNNLKEKIAVFKEEFLNDKLKRILQLFSSFQNDILHIGKNRYKLPVIEKSKLFSYPENNFHLLIGEGKEIIFAGIKEDNVDENDVLDFIEKGTNVKGRGVKKILISLDELSPTARLIAKNNKLTIWDINEVNHLLSVYNKPMVSFKNIT